MKKFLKRANRGLLLGGIIIFVLVIYIIIDYTRFSSEKDVIKKQVENYIDSFFSFLENEDYEELSTLINNNWTLKPVMSDYYFTTKMDMLEIAETSINNLSDKNQKGYYDISDVTYRITSCSVKKAGPNMASVKLNYTATLNNYSPYMEIMLPFGICYSYTYDDFFNEDIKYISTFESEYTLYMYKEDGAWKFSQCSGFDSQSVIEEVK